jgi:hypothetical protein
MILSNPIVDDSRGTTYRIIFGVWLMIAGDAVIHDQVIGSIAPGHFTEYHEPVRGLSNPRALAAIHALAASAVKGIPFGLLCVWIGRRGPRRKVSAKTLFLGTLSILMLTECAAVATGVWVHRGNQPPYPPAWYPEHSLPILITQTVQITCYLSAFFLSPAFFAMVHRWRRSGS